MSQVLRARRIPILFLHESSEQRDMEGTSEGPLPRRIHTLTDSLTA